jgi:RNA polymerase sigma factor (sigma-70 family)
VHGPSRVYPDEQLCELVRGAAERDSECWNALVDRFSRLVWSVARSFGLSAGDAAEVSQTTWLRLAENIGRIKQPDRLSAWLVTTTRHECIRQRRLQERHVLIDGRDLEARPSAGPAADEHLLVEERDAALLQALTLLPERSRTLLTMLLYDPPIAYSEISEALGIPIGSIGPTRARALALLRKHLEPAGIDARD